MFKRVKTDADLPPIKRTWANYWEKEYRKMAEEVRKANKGVRRMQHLFHRAALEREQLRGRAERAEKEAERLGWQGRDAVQLMHEAQERAEGLNESCERYIRDAHAWRDRAVAAEAALEKEQGVDGLGGEVVRQNAIAQDALERAVKAEAALEDLRRHLQMHHDQFLEREHDYKIGCKNTLAEEAGFCARTLSLLLEPPQEEQRDE